MIFFGQIGIKSALILTFLMAAPLLAEPLPVSVEAEAAILINLESGAILYEKNSRERHYPASITKIATALYLLEKKGDNLDEQVEVSQEAVAAISTAAKKRGHYKSPSHWLEFGSSHIGLKKGEVVSLETLLYGLMLSSGNDAANAIAEAVSGTVSQFVLELNGWLKEIGCQATHFTNPHGLHHPDHQTSAYDMALITRKAMAHPKFREVVAALSYRKPESNKQPAVNLTQKNRLLRSGKYYYPKATGVKTGWTSDAEGTFVASAQDGDRALVAVLLHCTETGQTYREAIKLFDAAFSQSPVERQIVTAGPQSYYRQVRGGSRLIKTYADEGFAMRCYPAEEIELKGVLAWEPCQLPISKGQKVGEVQLFNPEGALCHSVALLAQEAVSPTLLYRAQLVAGDFRLWGRGVKFLIFIGTGGLLILLFRKKRSHRTT
jgi:serine-type D-Ala-D-Ala carboxypeptidase (penicillin-binding protein 5/6)